MLDRKEANKETKKREVLALTNKVEQVDRRDSKFVLPFTSCEIVTTVKAMEWKYWREAPTSEEQAQEEEEKEEKARNRD